MAFGDPIVGARQARPRRRRGRSIAAALDDESRDRVDDHREDEQDHAEVGERRDFCDGSRALELGTRSGRQRAGGVEEGDVDPGGVPITWVTAIASPIARPRPRMMAPTMPGRE